MNPLIAKLHAEQQERVSKGAPVPVLSEADRIAGLPIRDKHVVDMTPFLKMPGGSATLRPVQSEALEEIRKCRGGFFPIGVGHGKSLIALLAGTVLNSKCTIVFCPASTVKTLKRTLRDFSEHFRMPSNIHIRSYAILSRPEGTRLIDKLKGEIASKDTLIVCDEVHRIKHMQAARTKRVIHWYKENPEASFVGLSGTITAKSIKDFAHLIALALRGNSPLPLNIDTTKLWCHALDVPNAMQRDEQARAKMQGVHLVNSALKDIQPVTQWAESQGLEKPINEQKEYKQRASLDSFVGKLSGKRKDTTQMERKIHARKCFSHRMRSSPGVVATKVSSANASLYVSECQDVYLTPVIEDAIQYAKENNSTPGMEFFDTELAAWRCFRQLSWGYYLQWDWGTKGPDQDWLYARKFWNRSLYRELQYKARPGYDSRLLVINEIRRQIEQGVRMRDIHRAWLEWDTQRHKPTPPTVATWIDSQPYLRTLHDIVDRKKPAAIWVDSQEMQNEAKKAGYTVYGAGADIPEHPHTAVLSIAAHGIGKNLTQWSSAHVLTWQSDGIATEQLLGRHHRPGQQSDEVWFHAYTHTPTLRSAFEDSFVRARYIKHITGNDQKLLLATTV